MIKQWEKHVHDNKIRQKSTNKNQANFFSSNHLSVPFFSSGKKNNNNNNRVPLGTNLIVELKIHKLPAWYDQL